MNTVIMNMVNYGDYDPATECYVNILVVLDGLFDKDPKIIFQKLYKHSTGGGTVCGSVPPTGFCIALTAKNINFQKKRIVYIGI